MMDQYTPQAREALSLAVSVAESLNHGVCGGRSHLLIRPASGGQRRGRQGIGGERRGENRDRPGEPVDRAQSHPLDSGQKRLHAQSQTVARTATRRPCALRPIRSAPSTF